MSGLEFPDPWVLPPDAEAYLELGYGLDPAALRGNRRFDEGKVSLAIDAADDRSVFSLESYADKVLRATSAFRDLVKLERSDEDIRFIIGNAARMPLPSSSIHEVYAANLLNAMVEDETKRAIISEGRRVLKPEHRFITRTVWDFELYPPASIERMLSLQGLRVLGHLTTGDSMYGELLETFGTPEDVDPAVGFFTLAEKIAY